jgi:hypothetical protein
MARKAHSLLAFAAREEWIYLLTFVKSGDRWASVNRFVVRVVAEMPQIDLSRIAEIGRNTR